MTAIINASHVACCFKYNPIAYMYMLILVQ